MNSERFDIRGEAIVMLIVSAVALLCQSMLSAPLAIGSAVPDFVLIAAILMAFFFSGRNAIIAAFLLGLLYNVFFGGIVGSMSVALLIATGIVVIVYSFLNNDSVPLALVLCCIAILIAEIAYAGAASLFNSAISFGAALTYRALPCALYNVILGGIVYYLAHLIPSFLAKRGSKVQPWQR